MDAPHAPQTELGMAGNAEAKATAGSGSISPRNVAQY
jgi:hypothetical protein